MNFPFQISTSHQCNPSKVSHVSSVTQVYQMRTELLYIFDACFNSYSRLICFQSLIEVSYLIGFTKLVDFSNFLGGGGWQGRRTSYVTPSIPPSLIFKAKFKLFVRFKISVTPSSKEGKVQIYGGPQLSQQQQITHSNNKLIATITKTSHQNQIAHSTNKMLTAQTKLSQHKPKLSQHKPKLSQHKPKRSQHHQIEEVYRASF